jgi:release factor glutamine methyltransferase
MTTIAQAIQCGIQQLQHSSDTPKLDSEILLLKVLNSISAADTLVAKTRTWLLTWPETFLTAKQLRAYQQSLNTRARGMPVAYITAKQGFWTFDLEVTTDTLVPRPETELLVECALDKIPEGNASENNDPENNDFSILELGTGSGAIALALAYERPEIHILASDFSTAALEVAQRNARQLKLSNIKFMHSCWFESIKARNNSLIVSNPPYIPEADPHLQQTSLQYEPQFALSSGHDGLNALRIIIHQSPNYLKTGGWLLFEHGFDQKESVHSLLRKEKFTNIITINDLNDQPRVSMGQKCN